MKSKNRVHFCWLLVVLSLWLGYCNLVSAGSVQNDQIDWLIGQQDTNTGLVESYEDITDTNSWIHDQALAIMAFTAAGELERAREILNTMKDIQLEDKNNAWVECYNAPDSSYAGCWKYITGPIAWMVMSVNFYECRTGDPNYASMARMALGWLDTMRSTDPNGPLRFCENCDIPNAISTEHNVDAYSAYYWRGMLDANDSYLYKANLILDYLRKEMWAPTPGSNCVQDANVFCRGYNDSGVLATDCQSWAVLSLGPVGPEGEEFYESLYWLLDSDLQTTCDFNDNIRDVNGFKSESDEQCDYIRVDLTESVAGALFSIGDDVNSTYFHSEMGQTVDANGGLFHSFNRDEQSCADSRNYVASASWSYLNELRINPFNLRPCFAECRAANINGTGRINFIDYAIFALDWLETGSDLAGDINKDRRVQWMDLHILTEYWLVGCND